MPQKQFKKKVIISVSNDLVGDNRVFKVANSLISFGFNVKLVGRKLKKSLPVDYSFETRRFRLIFSKGPIFYAEFNIRLFILLLFSKSDIFLSNDLDTLPANFLASTIRKKKLVYDSHELFTEVPELVNRKRVRKIWKKIEKNILPKVKYSYTVCDSIAGIYKELYGINMEVVRNIPNCTERKYYERAPIFEEFKNKTVIIYQGVLNIGRGLECMIKAMQYINNSVLLILGDGDISENLKELTAKLNLNDKVSFTDKIPIREIQSYTKFADIGISIEENIGLNYYYALPNKLFDYIKAKIPVLVSRLPEMEKIVNAYDIGEFIEIHNPEHIAERINSILNNKSKMLKWKENLDIASKELCWENEEEVLRKIFTD